MECTQVPVTRRELREAEARARRRSVPAAAAGVLPPALRLLASRLWLSASDLAPTSRDLAVSLRSAALRTVSQALTSDRLAVPRVAVPAAVTSSLRAATTATVPASVRTVAAMTLTAALLGGGVAEVVNDGHVARQVAAQAAASRAAVAAAEDAALVENATLARATRTQAARLQGKAVSYAAVKRTEALAVARAVVAEAEAVAATAGPAAGPEALTPLDQARATLTAMIEAAPDPVVQAAALASPAQGAPTTPTDAVPATSPSAVPTVDLASEPVTALAPGSSTLEARADRPAARSQRAVSGEFTPPPAAGTTTGPTTPAASTAEQPAGTVPAVAEVPVVTSEQLAIQLTELDLGTSAQIVGAAQLVADLSAQVQATAEANLAAAAAAAEARAAAEAAASAAAQSQSRKASLATKAPNGQIPVELLCGVSFQRNVQLRCDAAQALEALNTAYRAAFGSSLQITSTYRSLDQQVAVKSLKGGLASQPGRSNHGRGLAVDFGNFGGVGQFTNPSYRWMKENGPAFGWYHPPYMGPGGTGPLEPWHFEFGKL